MIWDRNAGLPFLSDINAGQPEDRHSPPELKREWQIMLILKASAPKTSLIAEGTYTATLKTIKGLPNDENPRKLELGFKTDNHEGIVTKELPFSFDEGTPLRNDAETLLGQELTASEAQDGVNPSTLIGKRCRVVVMHKSSTGGKAKAVVSVIMAEGENT